MRPFCVVMALLVCSSSMAEEPRPAPSTTAKVVKGLDWTAVSLLSAGLVLQSASLLSSNGRPDPLFTAAVVSFVGGVMTGLVSSLVKAVMKLSSPLSDVPGPYELLLAPSRAGRVVQTTGLVVAMVGLLSHAIGNVMASVLDPGSASRRAATWLQIGGGLTAAAGMMGAMVGGELREAPTLSVAPMSGGAVVGLSGQW